jgi:hypothetical protein
MIEHFFTKYEKRKYIFSHLAQTVRILISRCIKKYREIFTYTEHAFHTIVCIYNRHILKSVFTKAS